MEVFLLDKPKYQRLYNCSLYDIDDIPWERRGHPFWGVFLLIGYVFFMILYIPCLWAMCVSHLRHSASYKLMIQLGFTQMIGLQFAGPYTGIQAIYGTVFCSAPDFKYVFDGIVSIHWIITSTTCDVLGFNRLCELYSSELAHTLFGGKRLYLWMAFPLVYGGFMYWNMAPLTFNSYMMAYFHNPHYGYIEDTAKIYYSRLFIFHNTTICVTEIVTYITMPILFYRATRVASEELRSKIRYERKIFYQVVLIGLINFFASGVYILIQRFPVSLATSLVGTIGWFFTQGMTAIVYLTINHSIRRAILKKFGFRTGQVTSTSYYPQSQVSSGYGKPDSKQQRPALDIPQ